MSRSCDEHNEQWDAFTSAVESDLNGFMKKVFAAFHAHADCIPAFIKSVFHFDDDADESLFYWMRAVGLARHASPCNQGRSAVSFARFLA